MYGKAGKAMEKKRPVRAETARREELPPDDGTLLEGRNALAEALKSGRRIDKVFLTDGDPDRSLLRLAAQAKDRGAVIVSLPGDSEFDASGMMGEGVFHMNDLFFFAESVRDDMIRRAALWRASRPAQD